ncbi:MAG: aldehyde dehydrogenase family protein, partial [Terriglobales bacterium]
MGTASNAKTEVMENFIGGTWKGAAGADGQPVLNPATAEALALVPLSPPEEVDRAVRAAAAAFPEWRATPPGDRIQFLFRFKQLLEENLDELARTITLECGKTYAESVG